MSKPLITDPQERRRLADRATLVGAGINLVLAGAKIAVGWIGHSQALIVDGIHSLSDLASDAIVMIASKHGSVEADDDHPYGHGRIETVATVVLGAILAAVALGIGIDATSRLTRPEDLPTPTAIALWVALLSVFSKEALYWYTILIARRIRSNLLKANAWHHRSDAFSSVVVLIGVTGAMLGVPALDALAAMGVAIMIAKIGWDLIRQGVRELVDTGLEEDRVQAIQEIIVGTPGVRSLHMLRTRRMGPDALADVHIQVAPRLSVSEGHQISETVRMGLVAGIEELTDVTVHIDPEDDEEAAPCAGLPSRSELLPRLQREWQRNGGPMVEEVVMHYLDGKVHLDLMVDLEAMVDPGERHQFRDALRNAARQLPEIGEVRVYYH
ncbi:MAG: cation transporter [Gammaproteobacteria bacterium]|nr:cation transporter [Gammaproteobacteria bacterium]MCP5136124.1 cation transporter [Gammaproteobacteria bacterium]